MVPAVQNVPSAGTGDGQARLSDGLGGPRRSISADREVPVKDIYLLATEHEEPLSLDALERIFHSQEVGFSPGDHNSLCTITSGEFQVEVRFSRLGTSPPIRAEDLTGNEASQRAVREAKGFYWLSFEPGRPQASVAVFEALGCARNSMEE